MSVQSNLDTIIKGAITLFEHNSLHDAKGYFLDAYEIAESSIARAGEWHENKKAHGSMILIEEN